ncbi:MAG TPA: spermidine/putrescine ABC transporter permease [Clostridiaceae bacterium]|nr:spermidine/putrescine ABC transporter permease [Clostridiaceae bacterium]
MGTIYSILIYLFLYIPIFVLVVFSFNSSKLNAVWTGFSLKWYYSLFSNYSIMEAVKNSLIIAFSSTILSIIIGTAAAVGMYKYKFRGKSLIDGMLFIPLVIPEVVMGIAMLAFFSMIKLIPLGLITLIIAHVTFSVSYVIIVVRSRLDGFDKSLEEAAMDLGATPMQTFTKVTLPVIMPGIMAGGLLAFTLSIDDVIISFFVAGPGSNTLPLKVFSMVKFGVTPEINALSAILLVLTVSLVVIMQLLNKNIINGKKIISSALVCVLCITFLGGSAFKSAAGKREPQKVINVFNWSEYLPQSVIDKFEQAYNIKVNYSTFSSNEEMLAKLMAGGSQYDLVVASDYMVETLRKQNLIRPIDINNIENFKNLDESRLNLPFDPGNKYSIPYMWGDACIVFDASKVKVPIKGYKDLWNPALKNSIVVLDDERAIIGMVLKKSGYSINETDPLKLQQAKQDLKALQSNIKAYDSDSPKTLLINGEAKVGFVWGAEASLAKRENKNLKIVIPQEGLFLQQDNFVIPKLSKNQKSAEQFISFILEPEIGAEISREFPYASPNKASFPILDQDILKDTAVYPPQDAVNKGEYLKDIGQSVKLFDDIWTEVKNK